MENKYQVFAITGKSCAGKSASLKVTCEAHPLIFNKIVGCTTRPLREKEKDGVDYHFISLEDFTRKVLNGSMLEATEFRDWFYGTTVDVLVPDKINIGVFNPAAIEALIQDPRLEVTVFHLQAPDKQRLIRYLTREENPDCAEMCRRYGEDVKDFADLDFDYYCVDSSDGAPLDIFHIENSFADILSEAWGALGVDTEFETIMRWESSVSSMAIKATSENDKDKID